MVFLLKEMGDNHPSFPGHRLTLKAIELKIMGNPNVVRSHKTH
jgi:hypothetical protein